MQTNESTPENDFSPIRLHLELKNEYLSDHHKDLLRRYGDSSTGESISRDILIPSDMPLHNLHYAIQRLFGWQNSHLRKVVLPEEDHQQLTGGTVKGWAKLVGILFQPPSEGEQDVFWDDEYQSGSIKVWLKKKYTGPYVYGGQLEYLIAAKADIKELLNHYPMLDVRESMYVYEMRKQLDENTGLRIVRSAPMSELTIEEMNHSVIIENGTDKLLERLEINKVLACQGEPLAVDDIFPVTDELIYCYDFGDDWTITITKQNDCKDLLASGAISQEELFEAEETVLVKHKPVCIHKDGVSVLDDVGGLRGFAEFLGNIYESDDKEEREELRDWAESLGWSSRKISNKMML